jgi:hypothetical protein
MTGKAQAKAVAKTPSQAKKPAKKDDDDAYVQKKGKSQ